MSLFTKIIQKFIPIPYCQTPDGYIFWKEKDFISFEQAKYEAAHPLPRRYFCMPDSYSDYAKKCRPEFLNWLSEKHGKLIKIHTYSEEPLSAKFEVEYLCKEDFAPYYKTHHYQW